MKLSLKHIFFFLAVVLHLFSAESAETVRWNAPVGVRTGAALTESDGYYALIPTPVGFVRVGGATESGNRVTLHEGDKVRELPVLPVQIEQPYGHVWNNILFVSGISKDSGNPSLWQLDFGNHEEGWKKLTEVPGEKRGRAALAVQSNGANPAMYIIGGYDEEGRPVAEGYAYDTVLKRWKTIPAVFPEGITAGMPTGANHILLAGHDGKGNAVTYRFHTITSAMPSGETTANGIDRVKAITKSSNGITLLAVDSEGHPVEISGEVENGNRSMGWINWCVIVLYFVVLAAIGVYFARKQKNTDDYFKGGGRIPWWAAGLSLFGTALSAITFMAIPAKAFCTDWSYALFNVGIVLVAPVIVWVFIPYYRKLNITTAYQYLEIRFNALIRVVCSLAFIIFQVGRMGVVLFLPAIALNVVTGMDIFLCIGIMGVCSIVYTMTGGIEAVVWTDALQVVILLGGALFAVCHIIGEVPGGLGETISLAHADGKFSLGALNLDLQDATVWTVILAAFFTNLTTYGTDQSMVQRYLTTSSEASAKKSVWTNAILVIPATVIFFFIGTALYAYYKTYPEQMSMTVESSDAVFPWYIFTQLPAGVVGLLISGIFAAAMSTLSGSMNSAATAYIVDIYPRIFRKGSGSLQAARTATLVIGCISLGFAFLMATWNVASLWDEFQKILGLILGSMGGLFLLGMLTKRANSGGALVGIAVSMGVQYFVASFHTVHLLLYTASGLVSCFVVGYLASFLFNKRTKSI